MSAEIIELLHDLNRKIDSLSKEISNMKTVKTSRRSTPSTKIEMYKLSTPDLLSSTSFLCAYMQKNDCEGHCGKEAKFSVINGNPVELSDIQIPPAKDEKKEKLRRAYLRCNTCKNKGKSKDTSRGYQKVYDFLYDNGGDDEVFDDEVAEMISPKIPSKNKKSVSEEEPPSARKGLDSIGEDSDKEDPDPEDINKNLKRTQKFQDKFVSVKIEKEKVNCIIRSFNDKRKNDICIGEISDDPDESDYEDDLKKPRTELLEKIGLKYKTPEDSIKETPKKDKKKPQVKKDDSDSDSESDREVTEMGTKALRKMNDDSDSDSD